MHKVEWFRYVITASFLLTVILEFIAIFAHQYTVSDFVLENTRFPFRIALCVWLFFHLVVEYWGVYR